MLQWAPPIPRIEDFSPLIQGLITYAEIELITAYKAIALKNQDPKPDEDLLQIPSN